MSTSQLSRTTGLPRRSPFSPRTLYLQVIWRRCRTPPTHGGLSLQPWQRTATWMRRFPPGHGNYHTAALSPGGSRVRSQRRGTLRIDMANKLTSLHAAITLLCPILHQGRGAGELGRSLNPMRIVLSLLLLTCGLVVGCAHPSPAPSPGGSSPSDLSTSVILDNPVDTPTPAAESPC